VGEAAMTHLDRRQTLATGPAAIAERGASALARVALQKTVLPFAPDFRRLILSFHVFLLSCCPFNQGNLPGAVPPRQEPQKIAALRRVSTVQFAFLIQFVVPPFVVQALARPVGPHCRAAIPASPPKTSQIANRKS